MSYLQWFFFLVNVKTNVTFYLEPYFKKWESVCATKKKNVYETTAQNFEEKKIAAHLRLEKSKHTEALRVFILYLPLDSSHFFFFFSKGHLNFTIARWEINVLSVSHCLNRCALLNQQHYLIFSRRKLSEILWK